MLNPSKGDVILDLGCGEFAVLEKSIACFCDEILALDINPQALMKAKSNSLFNVHFIGASVAALPFKSKCVNKIAALELIEHLSKEIEGSFFKEAKLVLKESGYLVISTPNDSNVLINLLDPHWLTGHRHYRLKFLEEQLMYNGFEVQTVQLLGGIIEALCYVFYLTWHLFWSHLLKRKEPPMPFQRATHKLSALDYSRLGVSSTHIFLRAVKA